MNEREAVPRLLVRIDNLIHSLRTLSAELSLATERLASAEARLANIERACAVPLSYTVKQAAQRLEMSMDWCYRHLPEHVPPSSQDPLRFPVAEIDALALSRQRKKAGYRVEAKAG